MARHLYSSSLPFAAQIMVILITRVSSEKTCIKKDICSCEMSDGSGIVSLWPADGGKHPSFVNIKENQYTFEWNPCTPFTSEDQPAKIKCKDIMMCQHKNPEAWACGTKSTNFSLTDGNVIIEYGPIVDQYGQTRKTQISLKCDKSAKGKGDIPSISEDKTTGKTITYKGEFTSQYACPTQSSGSLSTGSVLLIVFFPLLMVYIVGGMLINRYQRGIESVPEVCPNYLFWAEFPVLVKDGCVFFFTSLISCCKSAYAKCNGESYASI